MVIINFVYKQVQILYGCITSRLTGWVISLNDTLNVYLKKLLLYVFFLQTNVIHLLNIISKL